MQKQENFVFEGYQSTFWIKMQFGIGHPPPTHQLHSTCVGEGSRVPNLQTEFNYLDSFKSYGSFSDFVVPCGPHIVSIVPTSSPSSPCHPRVISVIPTSSPKPPEGPHVVTMAVVSVVSSVVSVVSTPCCLRGPHVVPTSPSSPHHLEGHHIIPNPSDTHSTHPPPPRGVGGPKSVKMQFELIKIF